MPARASVSSSAKAGRTFSSISPRLLLMAISLSMMARRLNSKSPRDPRASRPRTSSPSNLLHKNSQRAVRFGVPPVLVFHEHARHSERIRQGRLAVVSPGSLRHAPELHFEKGTVILASHTTPSLLS